ncbi:exonuclease SbcCD subunit D C-terminal domain-containing protein [Desulfotalea psychrophila]|uniref:Nuclease SbcCD subunit D n=1 Tax=Desulfotalea psychrophila (strain LSv54 / DSM 12343) TaxID=177439 RepID=Q6AQW8_DESPS|nr:exonuclease SbcCD subunit D C-terminal domain-containing protein [Desulfotalea psychrophila]CAG35256.1 related to ATP-dependent dsDNA exonuclease (SbcD) [Desulfotalea psychrophila LSv54]
MKFLHTSDWHLGRSLYGHKRYREFALFLDWLAETIMEREVDTLLVAGDIFDTSTPSNRAQELYYAFLCRVAGSCCHHIVIIGGNHDSPSFLDAPKELLRALDVHVVGAKTALPEEEVIALRDGTGQVEALVCAVPYLRDRDVRTLVLGESCADKQLRLIAGIEEHYQQVVAIALEKQRQEERYIPIIGMGHLFTIGGKTVDGDGVRDLYVGTLASVEAAAISCHLDYLALGHLHVPQRVAGSEVIRYSGSPLPMGFGEASQQKIVVEAEFLPGVEAPPRLELVAVPCFQQLATVSGSLEEILIRLAEYRQAEGSLWLQVEYTGELPVADLRQQIESALEGSQVTVLRIKNLNIREQILCQLEDEESLDDLGLEEVFDRCLSAYDLDEGTRAELAASYGEIVRDLLEKDENRE